MSTKPEQKQPEGGEAMCVDEIKKMRTELERNITRAVTKFTKQTGLTIRNVNIRSHCEYDSDDNIMEETASYKVSVWARL
jgi:hypothetical protein